MIKTIKVMLCSNNKQKTKLFAYAGLARFAYNWALDYEKKNYESGNTFISDCDLRRIFTVIKSEEEYKWLNSWQVSEIRLLWFILKMTAHVTQ